MVEDMQKEAILLADKAFDNYVTRKSAEDKKEWANIPAKPNRRKSLCSANGFTAIENLIERFFEELSHFQALRLLMTKTLTMSGCNQNRICPHLDQNLRVRALRRMEYFL